LSGVGETPAGGALRQVNANGLLLPVMGQGTWFVGDRPEKAPSEMAALRLGVELGLVLIDTAEIYGDGDSELLVGRAIEGLPRERLVLVSKVHPSYAGRRDIGAHCEASLRRLGADYLDLYLLHWPGPVPLEETVEGMEALVRAGKIRRWGVSNFDVSDMEELWRVPGGDRCAADQVLYNLGSRGVEFDLLPWLAARKLACMAYCPIAQAGRLKRMGYHYFTDDKLIAIAERNGLSVAQLMLAHTLRDASVCAIPKASSLEHVRENAAVAAGLAARVPAEDWAAVDKLYPPPSRKMHLDIE